MLVSDGAALVALWPLMIGRRGGYRVARTLGCGNDEEYGGPLLADPADARVYTAALDALRDVKADVLELRMLDCNAPLAAALAHTPQSWVRGAIPARWRRLDGYSIALSSFATYDAYLATRPESLRGPLRRRARRLADRGQVEYGWCQNADDAREVLTWLFANKRRWALARGLHTAYLMDDQLRDFFIDLARRIDLVTTPLVYFVKLNGSPVAAALNIVGPRTIEYYITTYDEAYAAFSVGNLLIDRIARWAHASGRDVDFRPYYSIYKERWSNRKTWHEHRFIMLTWRGRLAEVPLAMEQIRRIVGKIRDLAVDRLRAKVPAPGETPQAPEGTSQDA
ncbi:GNAT family N-acetyltransferase [Paraburkholderia sp. MMS20-SJTN17]|uniref:GNAT family N-acetyltransferase n=1 Tax=Paraburkholderia translucens TaxID=2886945 RepID=A0ABS8K9D7_9BURK|nr:GNAT family N-acetyltransferase [Paraburkholderia sp. MMS20-SJTN17]MCC8401282.1 GNAT family N-acetyltransferase [Paraburkholderia sp. MMS20-SJTN17]